MQKITSPQDLYLFSFSIFYFYFFANIEVYYYIYHGISFLQNQKDGGNFDVYSYFGNVCMGVSFASWLMETRSMEVKHLLIEICFNSYSSCVHTMYMMFVSFNLSNLIPNSFFIIRKYLDAQCVFFWETTPTLSALFTFGLYSLMGTNWTPQGIVLVH